MALKSVSGWTNANGISGNGTDAYGFSALPAGYMIEGYAEFFGASVTAVFWSASQHEYLAFNAYGMTLGFTIRDDSLYGLSKHGAVSVRCIKND